MYKYLLSFLIKLKLRNKIMVFMKISEITYVPNYERFL
jgi:hypothetical protein